MRLFARLSELGARRVRLFAPLPELGARRVGLFAPLPELGARRVGLFARLPELGARRVGLFARPPELGARRTKIRIRCIPPIAIIPPLPHQRQPGVAARLFLTGRIAAATRLFSSGACARLLFLRRAGQGDLRVCRFPVRPVCYPCRRARHPRVAANGRASLVSQEVP